MNVLRRLWTYQAERFPLIEHGFAVATFVAAGVLVTVRLTGTATPGAWTFVVAFALSLLLFLQLRVADEFKDAEDDRRFRPERPVPRGLISLRLLGGIAAGAAVVQLVLALTLAPAVAVLLAMAWAWLALMTVEFGVGRWLRARPMLYLASHMVIMPLVAILVTGCVWATAGVPPPDGAAPFVALAFANGCVLEIGRKVWAPEEEREGVETYSRLWGPKRAAGSWIVSVVTAAALLALALAAIDGPSPGLDHTVVVMGGIAAINLVGALWAGVRFRWRPTLWRRKRISETSILCVVISYLALAMAAGVGQP
jgi:4-hydroxybenzoate polyprenyltransferase